MGPARLMARVGFFLLLVACGAETGTPQHAGSGPGGTGGLASGGQGGEAGATAGSGGATGGATGGASDAGYRETSSPNDGTIDSAVLDGTGTPPDATIA